MNLRTTTFTLFTTLAALSLNTGCVASDKNTIAQASAFDTGLKPAQIQGAQTNQYLQQIGGRIVAAARELDAEKVGPKSHFAQGDNSWMFQDIQFQLVNSKTVNAFTTGGHYVYIYLELFKMCKTEDELAAVMSHEYGHIYCRHVQKGTGRQQALALASVAAGGAGYVAGGKEQGAQYSQTLMQAAQAGGGFIDMGFTRGDEAQADEFGFKFYVRAGWDPSHFGDFFKDMIAAGYDKGSALTSDHPTLKSRVEAADKRVQELNPQRVARFRKPPIADQQQFDAYKAEALRAAQNVPDDQKVLQAKNLLQALPRSCWLPYDPEDQKQAQQQIIQQAQQQQGK
jgi:predicted Zn-dependent protease